MYYKTVLEVLEVYTRKNCHRRLQRIVTEDYHQEGHNFSSKVYTSSFFSSLTQSLYHAIKPNADFLMSTIFQSANALSYTVQNLRQVALQTRQSIQQRDKTVWHHS